MKQMKMLSTIMLSVILTGMMFLAGCEKNDVEVTNVTDQQILEVTSMDEMTKISVIKDPQILAEVDWLWRKKYISQDQFCSFHKKGVVIIQEKGMKPFYPVEGGNYLMTREYVQYNIEQTKRDKQARHRRYDYMYMGGNITVKVHSNIPSEWAIAISEACAAWNGLGVNITFSPYSSTNNTLVNGQLDFRYASLGDPLKIARADPYYSNTFSEFITINSGGVALGAEARKMNVAHELGHAIGLLHTDTYDGLAVHPYTTCNGNRIDPNSIMKSSIGQYDPWTGFTSCDFNVINYYWGESSLV